MNRYGAKIVKKSGMVEKWKSGKAEKWKGGETWEVYRPFE